MIWNVLAAVLELTAIKCLEVARDFYHRGHLHHHEIRLRLVLTEGSRLYRDLKQHEAAPLN